MRKFIAILTALCLMLVPAMSLADDVSSSYFWSTDTEFDLYDLGFSINIPENWTRADDETIAAMNGECEDAQAADDTTDNATALSPYAIAMMANADNSASMMIACEDVEDPEAIVTPDQYIELFANDLVISSAESGVTYTYDTTAISDATLCTQTFREMALSGSDGSIIDLLVCHSGMGTYYSFVIVGTADSITPFAQEFVNAVAEIDAVG